MLAVFHSKLLGQELNNPAIPVFDVNLEKMKIAIQKGVCPSLVVPALCQDMKKIQVTINRQLA